MTAGCLGSYDGFHIYIYDMVLYVYSINIYIYVGFYNHTQYNALYIECVQCIYVYFFWIIYIVSTCAQYVRT